MLRKWIDRIKRLRSMGSKQTKIRFRLSGRFEEEDGSKAVWEMRRLTLGEKIRIREREAKKRRTEFGKMVALAAEALTVPNLHNKELLVALTERENRFILTPADAILVMLNEGELRRLIRIYAQLNEDAWVQFEDETPQKR